MLRYCDPEEQIRMSVYANSLGIGAVLLQGWQPIAYVSKAITQTEKNYAQIEKNMLAMVFGCTRFHKPVYGYHNAIAESDHKPSETIWRKQKPTTYNTCAIAENYNETTAIQLADRVRARQGITYHRCTSHVYVTKTGDPLVDDDLSVKMIDIITVSSQKVDIIQQENVNRSNIANVDGCREEWLACGTQTSTTL